MQSLIDWFDCIELTDPRNQGQSISMRSGDTKRDRLFFKLSGVSGSEEKPKSKFGVAK